jgi:sarcosine oxidase
VTRRPDADVGIIGLGTTGSMAAWRLACAGLSVHGFEQFGIAHDRGAAGGESRRFATHSMGDPRDVPLAVEAARLWRELEAETGRDILTLNGGITIGPRDAPGLINAEKSAVAYGLPYEHWGTSELRRRFPQHGVDSGHEAVVDPNGGFLRPQLAVMAAVTAARARGAAIHDHNRVLAIEPDADGVSVRTTTGTMRFGKVIVAPGPWSGRLLPQLNSKIQTRRVLQAWFLPDKIGHYLPEVFPVFQRTGDVRVYGFPTIDGVTVKLGIFAEVPEVVEDPDHLSLEVSQAQIRYFHELVAANLPDLHPDAIRVSVYMEGYTTSMKGLVGPLRDMPNVIALCGLSGTGFKFAPVLGEVAAQYADKGQSSYNVQFLAPDRPQEPWSGSYSPNRPGL